MTSTPSPEPAPGAEQSPSLWTRLGPAGFLAVLATVLPPLGSIALFTYIKSISEWLRSHEGAGIAVYAAGFAILGGLALLPTYAQSALGGYAFGFAWGFPAALAGFAGGALIGYEIARRASGDRVLRIIAERPKLRAVHRAFLGNAAEGRGFLKTTALVALVRCPPNSPFALTNLLLASLAVPRPAYLFGTIIGMAPRTAAAVFIGHTLRRATSSLTEEELKGATPSWVWIAGLVVSFFVLGVIGYLANRAVSRAAAVEAPAPAAPGAGSPP